MVTLNEKENLKIARALAVGSLRKEINPRVYDNGKHFVWLEKWGYDAAVLSTHVPSKVIIPATDDPDIAMEVQERYPGLEVQCGDPVEIVRKAGRVFSSMALGLHRPFTPEFLETITSLLQHGLKESGGFYLALNFGDPEGDELLREGYEAMLARAKMETEFSDRRTLEVYYHGSDEEDKKKILKLLSNPESQASVIELAREYVQEGAKGLREIDSPAPNVRAQILTYSFLNLFRDRTYTKKFAAMPYEFTTIEDKDKKDWSVIFGSKIIRGSVGEKPERFSIRLEEMSAKTPRVTQRLSADKPDLIKSFYDDGYGKPWGNGPFPWELYFSLETDVVTEWRKSWLKDLPPEVSEEPR